MHCKVALICLLGITAINAMVIRRVSFQINPSEAIVRAHSPLNIEQPSRLLLPPFEDYVGSQLYSNGNYRSTQPAGQLRNEGAASHEEFAPQPYPYEVVNRVLPHVGEPTDFQPLEQQLTKTADEVKSVQQNVNEFENYLQGVAATLAPQNKAKNSLSWKLVEVPISDLAEKELENFLSSLFEAESTVNHNTAKEEDFENRISSILVEDSTVSDRHAKEKDLQISLASMLRKESTDNDSAEEEKAFEKFLSNAFEEEDYTESDKAKELKEADNLLSILSETDFTESDNARDFTQKVVRHNDEESIDKDSVEAEKAFENFPSNAFEEEERQSLKQFESLLSTISERDSTESDKPKYFDQKTALHNYDAEEAGTTYLDQLFDAAVRGKEYDEDDDFTNPFASSIYLNDDYFIR